MRNCSGRDVVGVACIIRSGAFLVLEIQKPHKWVHTPQALWVGAGCIGGDIEHCESPIQALQRECVEEIGINIEVLSSGSTLLWTRSGSLQRADWRYGAPGPALLWEVDPEFGNGRVAVYLGVAIGEPQPADLPAVLLLRPELVHDLLGGEWSLERILDAGGTIRTGRPVPLQALLQPRGTLAVLRDMAIDYPNQVGQILTLAT